MTTYSIEKPTYRVETVPASELDSLLDFALKESRIAEVIIIQPLLPGLPAISRLIYKWNFLTIAFCLVPIMVFSGHRPLLALSLLCILLLPGGLRILLCRELRICDGRLSLSHLNRLTGSRIVLREVILTGAHLKIDFVHGIIEITYAQGNSKETVEIGFGGVHDWTEFMRVLVSEVMRSPSGMGGSGLPAGPARING